MSYQSAVRQRGQEEIAKPLHIAVWIMAPVLVSALLAGCAFGGPDLQMIADQFVAPSSWQTIDDTEVIESLCIGPDCKSVLMAWGTNAVRTGADFESLMHQAGWEDIEVDDCEVRTDVTGRVPFCRPIATSGDTHVELTAAGPMVDESLTLRIALSVSSK